MTDVLLKLNTGATIPALGLGTWQSPEGQVRDAVANAIKVGYRHIDCADVYGNEKEVGDGIQQGLAAAGIARKDLFVTTKVWCTNYLKVEESLHRSLQNLGLDYVDLFLLHWPIALNPNGNHPAFPTRPDGKFDVVPDASHVDTYKKLEKLLATGKVNAIGVSNYSKKLLEELLPQVKVVPAVNQIENHPLLPQYDVLEYSKEKGIHTTAYSPFGSTGTPLFQDPRIIKLAENLGTTPGSILLSYHIAKGNSVIPKSVTPSRIDENKKVVLLSHSDLASLEEISKNGVTRFVDPGFPVDLGWPDRS